MLAKSKRILLGSPSIRPFSSFLKFDYKDPLLLDQMLTDEERMVQESAHNYAREKLLPRVTKAYQDEHFDREIMREYGEMGFLGCTISDYGLPGVSSVAYGLINKEVEAIDSGYRSALSVQSSLVMYPINAFGSQEIKDKYIPGLATGELVGCFGLTEPDAGSDPAGMKTKAKDLGSEYSLTGSKTWITNSPIADVFVVWAKLEGTDEIRGFVLERSMGGIETPKIEGKLSLRASTTGMILMDDVRVPKENMFTTVKGLKGPFSCLNQARFGIAWGTMGAAEFCFHAARDYTMDRK